ncbi:unnamed protein product [Caenorhabditis bovis]|uniref:Uncharacterized protein n=1 Tax=Caenorhabditis bovis TaxID=2654633 RepID=A0A8S1ERF9_9PELO|nr:unnamed protein product [Caenorhabditis bovis]
MRAPLLIIFATCAAFADAIGTMLVQGHADTIKTLRNIVMKSAKITHHRDQSTWHLPAPEVTTMPSDDPLDRPPKLKTLGKLRARRHISNVVVESGQCDHIDLVDCSDYETDEMTCMMTATGMTCCVCTGVLRAAKRTLFW